MFNKSISKKSLILMTLGITMIGLIVGFSFLSDSYSLAQLFEGVFVYAQGTDDGMSDLMSTVLDSMQAMLQIIYIVMWPLMYIAGLAMDNTLVYGEFINLDSILWTMWGVSRNLANFALGGFVLFEVVKYAFAGQDSNVSNVFKVIKGALIAGVGIQFSWFLLAALIDISSVLIISLGGLPLTLMENFGFGNQPILGVQGYLNLSDTNNGNNNKTDALVYYTRGDFKFPTCRVVNGYVVGGTHSNIINEDIDFTQDGQDKRYCAFGTQTMVNITDIEIGSSTVADSVRQIVKYNQIKERDQATLSDSDKDFIASMDAIHPDDDISVTSLAYHAGNMKGVVDAVPGRSTDLEGNPEIKSLTDAGVAVDWKTEFTANPKIRGAGTYLSDLTENGEGFVGPLTTLYVSLLEFSNLHTTAVGSAEAATGMSFFFEFMLKSIIGLMLIVPLIILAVVLIMRVAILWMVIAFSPILALAWGFGKDSWLTSVSSKISIKNIIGLVFAPVLPVFILSLSIVFLQSLTTRFYDPANTGSWESLGIVMEHNAEASETCATIRGAMTFCYETQSDDTGNSIYANLFAWLLVNIFAVGLVRALVKLSFKGNDITQGVVNQITQTAGSIAGSIPLIPLPGAGGSGFVGANAFSQVTGIGQRGQGLISRKINEKYIRQTQEQVDQFFKDDNDEATKEVAKQANIKGKQQGYWDNIGTTGSATASDYLSKVYDQDISSATDRSSVIQSFNLNQVGDDSQGRQLLLNEFNPDITKALDDLKKNKTEGELDTAIGYLNGSLGQEYIANNKDKDLENQTITVTNSQGQNVTYTIQKVNGKLTKGAPVSTTPILANNTPATPANNPGTGTNQTNTPANTNGAITQNTTQGGTPTTGGNTNSNGSVAGANTGNNTTGTNT